MAIHDRPLKKSDFGAGTGGHAVKIDEWGWTITDDGIVWNTGAKPPKP